MLLFWLKDVLLLLLRFSHVRQTLLALDGYHQAKLSFVFPLNDPDLISISPVRMHLERTLPKTLFQKTLRVVFPSVRQSRRICGHLLFWCRYTLDSIYACREISMPFRNTDQLRSKTKSYKG